MKITQSSAAMKGNKSTSSSDNRPLCRFFVLGSNCRYGDRCSFSHVLPEGGVDEARKQIPCPFFAQGTCRYGDFCQLRHDKCEIISSPNDSNTQEEDALTCGICLECINKGVQNNKKFGLLSCCDHVFCFTCLMEWRKEGSKEAEDRRCCPTCRKHSNYVVPSNEFAIGEEKQKIAAMYKAKLAIIPCKKFDGILGSCPFGKDCFYMHVDEDGRDIKFQDKSMKELHEEQISRRNSHHENYYSDDVIDSLFLMLDLIWHDSEEDSDSI